MAAMLPGDGGALRPAIRPFAELAFLGEYLKKVCRSAVANFGLAVRTWRLCRLVLAIQPKHNLYPKRT